jgi:hypothetical protein
LMIYVEINVELFKSSAMIGMFVYLLKSCWKPIPQDNSTGRQLGHEYGAL